MVSRDIFGNPIGKSQNPFVIDMGTNSKPTRKTINKDLREKVWLKYMGNKVQGKCYCCEIKPIHFTDFEVGHNVAVAKGGMDHIENLRPICRSCNKGMGTKTIEWYKKKYYAKPTPKLKVTKSSTSQKSPKRKDDDPLGLGSILGKPPKRGSNPWGF